MATGTVYITTEGAILAAKTLESKTLTFSKFSIGDGELEDTSAESIKALTGLVNSVLDFDITKISRDTDTQVTVRGLFLNTDAESAFYLRELGLWAIDPDTEEEVLYAYVNYGDEAEYVNNSVSEKKEYYYEMVLAVDNADNVEINIDPTNVYITEKDFDEFKDEVNQDCAGAHNAIYEEKDVTEEFYDGTLSEQIAAGTFEGIHPGNYIIGESSGNKYYLADLNYWKNTGDTNCSTNHIAVIPATYIGNAQMNSSNITTGAYISSEMYTTNLETAKETIIADFGEDHILSHREIFSNATTSGYESGYTWVDSTIDLMNEQMVYGCNVFHNIMCGTNVPNNRTVDKSQLSIFKHRHDLIGIRTSWWLRDVVSSSHFARVDGNGDALYSNASNSYGVRPAFAII